MPNPLGTAQTAIGAILHLPPEALSEVVVPGSPFVGDGRLQKLAPGIGVAAWGFSWSFLTVPPELGVQNGAVPIWNQRLLQLAAFHNTRTAQHVSEILDVHHDAGMWLWQEPFPFAIGYSLLPGVTAQFRWLIFSIS